MFPQLRNIILALLFMSAYTFSYGSTTQQAISLDMQSIEVKSILQALAQTLKMNLIISDAVQGKMSLHINQLPPEKVLTIILKSQNLSSRRYGDVLLIAPTNEITAQQQAELKAQTELADLQPLQTTLIPLRFAKASELAASIKDKSNTLLSPRGQLNADPRTNSIWIEDTPNKLVQLKALIQQLDQAVPQILIEARIVNLDSRHEQDLGVRFGFSQGQHLSSTLAGATQLAQGKDLSQIPIKDRLSFDPGTARTGTLGIALAHLGHGILLDLELAALESEGYGEIISSPHLLTSNEQAAQIQAGEDIPYQEASSSGATSVSFKKAVLSLNVTPQISANGKIQLTLKVNQDQASSKLINHVPAINTREIETQVVVDNGQTIVLGGIYEQTDTHQFTRIPFLSTLPLIGGLFSSQQHEQRHRELLIFVTPKLVSS